MKSCKFSLSMFLTISMFCSLVAAQQSASTQSSAPVPHRVNFTGRTTDFQGKPIAGIAGVTFAIYKDQYEGAPLWLFEPYMSRRKTLADLIIGREISFRRGRLAALPFLTPVSLRNQTPNILGL